MIFPFHHYYHDIQGIAEHNSLCTYCYRPRPSRDQVELVEQDQGSVTGKTSEWYRLSKLFTDDNSLYSTQSLVIPCSRGFKIL